MRDVPRIWGIPDSPITNEQDIEEFIELPLRPCIRILLAKGIRTYWSTAHDTDPYAAIGIEPQHLSPANLELAKTAFDYREQDDRRIMLELRLSPDMAVSEVSQFFVDLANRFEDQSETLWNHIGQ